MGKTKRKGRDYTPERSCGKWKYPNRRVAEESRKRMEANDGHPYAVYGCTACGGFHLTSQVPRKRQVEGGDNAA